MLKGNMICQRRKDMGCSVTEWVKRKTLHWFGHVERMHNDSFVKKMYMSEVEGNRVRGRQPASWDGKVKYIRKRTQGNIRGMEHAREVCLDREA